MLTPDTLAVPGVRGLQPYQPGKPISELERELGIKNIIKLASNENPLGPSPFALSAMQTALNDVALYPDGSGFDLKTALAAKFGLHYGQITLGNGSNDVLDIIARTFLGPGLHAVCSQHAFAVYPIVTQAVGAGMRVATAHTGEHGPRYGHDLAAMANLLDETVRMVFIANPNNPTGTFLREVELLSFLKNLPEQTLVVVDEAYFEYVEEADYPNTLEWLAQFPNLIVTRTFSKAYGLAGVRVGYAVSSIEIAELLNRVRQPFNVNNLGLIGAEAALNDEEHLTRSINLNREGMAQLCEAFAVRSLAFIPSVGNFVTLDMGQSAAAYYEALLKKGVIVRPIANYQLPNHLRVTIGTREQNQQFLDALDCVLGL